MRHLGSTLLALLLTPIIYALLGIGVAKWPSTVHAGTPRHYYATLGIPLAAIITAGLAYAVLLLVRLSPFGPVHAGLALLGISMWATLQHSSFIHLVPRDLGRVQGAGWIAGPMTAMLAVPLISTIFSPRRWRRYADSSDEVGGFSTASSYPSTPTYAGADLTGYGAYPSSSLDDPNAFDAGATHRL
jgi:hypothetical protein